LIIDDQDRYAGLCRRAIPEHRYHGPARNWADAQMILKRLRRRLDLGREYHPVVAALHFG
ncbi:MAG: hypothetical protein ABGY41_17275, partial [Candidatus Poribacteria bacterium]